MLWLIAVNRLKCTVYRDSDVYVETVVYEDEDNPQRAITTVGERL